MRNLLNPLWSIILVSFLSLGLWSHSVFAEDSFDLFEDPAQTIQNQIQDQIKTSLASVTTSKELHQFQGRQVNEIEVLGLKRIEVDAIVAKMDTKKGSRLKVSEIASDIKSIYQMGYFDKIEILGEAYRGDQVNLKVIIQERPVIAELIFEGNSRIDTDELQDVVLLKQWAILDINKVREDIGHIQRHYEQKGFFLAKVNYRIEKIEDKDNEVKLIYKIRDYEKVEIKKITFLNNKVFSDDDLKGVLQETTEGSFFSFISSGGSFKETAFKQDLQRLTLWYLENGYVKFRFENPIVTVSDDKRWMFISLYVEEGEQYDVGEIDFSGDLLFPREELSEGLTLKSKDLFVFSKRNQDIQWLTEKYQDLGYAFVNVIPKMDIHDDTKTVDIDYAFEKGNLVHFGKIYILGNSKTHDKVIRREMRVYEGELFNGTNLRKSRERIERLGYFQPGEVIFNTVTRKGRDDIVDLEVSIKERSTGTITLGAGYGSIQKFFLQAQIQEINLFGKGQTISLQGQYAADSVSRSFNLSFTDPYAFDTKWSMGGDLFSIQFPIPNRYNLRKLGFNLRAGYPLNDDINLFLTYKNEGTKITQVIDPDFNPAVDNGILSSIVTSVVRDKRNNRFEPTDGSYQEISFEFAGIGGDKRFLKYKLNNRFYTPIVGDLVFRNNTEYGQIMTIANNPVPTAHLFYLGGPANMKGYETFTLGPTLVNSQGTTVPIGGVVEFFSVFEIEHPLVKAAGLKIVTFFDVGNAFSGFPGVNNVPFKMHMDAGFGFRWFSPIGPLRFEWGFPLNPRVGLDSSPVFSFFIGPPF